MSNLQRALAEFGSWMQDGLNDLAYAFDRIGRWAHPWGIPVVALILLYAMIASGAWKIMGAVLLLGAASLALPLALIVALALIGNVLGFVLYVAKSTERRLLHDPEGETS